MPSMPPAQGNSPAKGTALYGKKKKKKKGFGEL
jgi:hypothetical protein